MQFTFVPSLRPINPWKNLDKLSSQTQFFFKYISILFRQNILCTRKGSLFMNLMNSYQFINNKCVKKYNTIKFLKQKFVNFNKLIIGESSDVRCLAKILPRFKSPIPRDIQYPDLDNKRRGQLCLGVLVPDAHRVYTINQTPRCLLSCSATLQDS